MRIIEYKSAIWSYFSLSRLLLYNFTSESRSWEEEFEETADGALDCEMVGGAEECETVELECCGIEEGIKAGLKKKVKIVKRVWITNYFVGTDI